MGRGWFPMQIVSGAPSGNTERVSMEYIQINNCGYNEVDEFDLTTNRPNGRADYHLLYVWHGVVRRRDGRRLTESREGDLLLFRPWEPQIYTYVSCEQSLVYWLHFSGQGVPSLLRQSLLTGQSLHVGLSVEARDLFLKMIHELQTRRYQYEMFLNSHFMMLLSCLSRLLMLQKSGPGMRHQEAMTGAIEYIHQHLYENVPVEELARECSMSTSHFIHQFKDYTGFSPHTYQTRLRLEHAKELMGSTTMNIAEIAMAVGYDNPLYFSRLFHRHTGLSPSRYRECLIP